MHLVLISQLQKKITMKSNKSSQQSGEQYVIPTLIAMIIAVVVISLFSDDNNNNPAEFETTMSQVEDGRVVNKDWFSVEVSQLNRRTARKHNIRKKSGGVIVTEIEGGRDVRMKLREGDVICGINGKRIKSVRDFRKSSRDLDPEAGILLDINRNGKQMFVPITGESNVANSRTNTNRWLQRFGITETMPFLNRDINPRGLQMQDGVIGNWIEGWVNQNFGGGYFTCMNCGTLVPEKRNHANKTVYCPNCHKKMILK